MLELNNSGFIRPILSYPPIGNAALKGLSTSAQDESTRQAEKFKDAEDFVTIPAGSDVIVSLTKSYMEK